MSTGSCLDSTIQTIYTTVKEDCKDIFSAVQAGNLIDALLFTSLSAKLIKQLQQSTTLAGADKKTVALAAGKMILHDVTKDNTEEERVKKMLLFDLVASPMIDQIVEVAKQFTGVNPPKGCCVVQ